jgi:hypothetical protein
MADGKTLNVETGNIDIARHDKGNLDHSFDECKPGNTPRISMRSIIGHAYALTFLHRTI